MTHVTFSKFLTFIKIFYACFTKSKLNSTHRYNQWITGGMKLLCYNGRTLYVVCGGNDVTGVTVRYRRHSKILTDVIKGAKEIL
jgi:hypothetical protein